MIYHTIYDFDYMYIYNIIIYNVIILYDILYIYTYIGILLYRYI